MKKSFVFMTLLVLAAFAGTALAGGYCPWCGAQVESGWRYCPSCSGELNNSAPQYDYGNGSGYDSGYGSGNRSSTVPDIRLTIGKDSGKAYVHVRFNGVAGAAKYIITWKSNGPESGYLRPGEGHGSGQFTDYEYSEFYTSDGQRYEYDHLHYPVDYHVDYTYTVIAVFPDGSTATSMPATITSVRH